MRTSALLLLDAALLFAVVGGAAIKCSDLNLGAHDSEGFGNLQKRGHLNELFSACFCTGNSLDDSYAYGVGNPACTESTKSFTLRRMASDDKPREVFRPVPEDSQYTRTRNILKGIMKNIREVETELNDEDEFHLLSTQGQENLLSRALDVLRECEEEGGKIGLSDWLKFYEEAEKEDPIGLDKYQSNSAVIFDDVEERVKVLAEKYNINVKFDQERKDKKGGRVQSTYL
ncbi:hypothetical protein OXX69_008834 [Metschnikowia pulcherrima]